MKRLNRGVLLLLILVSIVVLTGCTSGSRFPAEENADRRWDLIGEWRYKDAMKQYYINLLDVDFSKHEVMMNFAFTERQGQSDETIVESREMLTYPMTWSEKGEYWKVECAPEGFEVLIRTIDTYSMIVNSNLLIRKNPILEN